MIQHFDTKRKFLNFVENYEGCLTIRGGKAYNEAGELVAKIDEIA